MSGALLIPAMIASPVLAAAYGPLPPAFANDSEYRVGPGDVLKLSVYRAPDLESTVRVAEDGTIAIGTIGRARVADHTVAEIGTMIADKLKSGGIFTNPTVNVLVAEYHSKTVSVLGAVGKPGEYPIDRIGLSITDVLARAGANLDNGSTSISISTPGTAGKTSQTLALADLVGGARDRAVRPGESLFVQTAPVFYISGEVQKPGYFPLQPNLTVGQAIAIAGGPTPRGTASRVKVTRQNGGKPGVPAKIGQNDPVQPNDLLVVGARIF